LELSEQNGDIFILRKLVTKEDRIGGHMAGMEDKRNAHKLFD
jgi:hypothetical protein